jgi:hypothetical protein
MRNRQPKIIRYTGGDTFKCYRCDTIRPIEDFTKTNLTKSGILLYCKICDRERLKKNYQKLKEDPVKIEKRRAYAREYAKHYLDKNRIRLENQKPITEKKCNKCTQILPADMFDNHAFTKDGKRGTCTPCLKIHRKQYYRKKQLEKRQLDKLN